MRVINKKQFLKNKERYMTLLKKGRTCIYPTDTIYGIGCDATNNKAVQHIYRIKHRGKYPVSVIAPTKQWIRKNCIVHAMAKKWMRKLPGRYTLILKIKNKKAVSRRVYQGNYTLGVRIPKHWFAKIVQQYGKPIVTTSVNISGKASMTSLKDLHKTIKKQVAFIIYEGEKRAHASTIIDCVAGKVKKR